MGSRRLTEESGRASVASWARIRDLQVFSVSERPKMKPLTGAQRLCAPGYSANATDQRIRAFRVHLTPVPNVVGER